MMLNDFGIVANEQWAKLAQRFTNFELDVFQIMPNHIHGIILLTAPVGAGLAAAQKGKPQRMAPTNQNNNNGTNDNVVTDDNVATDDKRAVAAPPPQPLAI